MNTLIYQFIVLGLLILPRLLYAVDYKVTREGDEPELGTLRLVLQDACDADGNDTITFEHTRLDIVTIKLKSPLVVPEDCNGTVSIHGSGEVDTLIDGSDLTEGGDEAGDSCSLHVYADGNSLQNLSFIKNELGAGVCFFGRNNKAENNRFGITMAGDNGPNRYGVVISSVFSEKYKGMDGAGNQVLDNQIKNNTRGGIWVTAKEAVIENNQIQKNEGAGIYLVGSGSLISGNTIQGNGGSGIRLQGSQITITSNTITSNGGCPPSSNYFSSDPKECLGVSLLKKVLSSQDLKPGILITEGSSDITIGGDSFEIDHNTVQFNRNGGVRILGDATSINHLVTHNIISKNYGSLPDLDLEGNGTTVNDWQDTDTGPNTLINTVDHFQAFPLVPTSDGVDRYWNWGIARVGDRIELYGVSNEDLDRGIIHGGADSYFLDVTILDQAYEVQPTTYNFDTGDVVTILSFDEDNNTSEYAINIRVGDDADLDGIIDDLEDGTGTGESEATASQDTDSDNDGLPDPVEDFNRNGLWDENLGELSAYNPDTDNDGLSDWSETHGDGLYHEGIDTDPFNQDSDGDSLLDGAEDANNNGIWDGYLLESSPLLPDSDGDGFIDSADTCPSIYNAGQEPWYCEF